MNHRVKYVSQRLFIYLNISDKGHAPLTCR